MHNKNNKALILAAAMLVAAPAVGEQVYHWTDEEGVVHFSQWMPENVDEVDTLFIASNGSREYDPSDDPYSIRNQAERTSETWVKLEEKKAERRKARRDEAERTAQQPAYRYPYYASYPYSNRYYPPYYPPVVRPPVHRPIHPGYKRKVQKYQVAALEHYNARSHIRAPYSSVTGVSQRTSIQSFPGMPRPNP